jgi:hypothetical protein
VLGATFNPHGARSSCLFEYGTSTAYGQVEACTPLPGSSQTPIVVSAALEHLIPGTAYHFRIRGDNVAGTTFGEDRMFVTEPVPPIVVTGSATNETETSVHLHATVNPNGLKIKKCFFEYGPSFQYASSARCKPSPGAGTSAVAVEATVNGLEAGENYYYRISATNIEGTSTGSDEAFTTLGGSCGEGHTLRFDQVCLSPPSVTTERASDITRTSATLHASVNPNESVTACRFEYGPTADYGSSVPCAAPLGSSTSVTPVSAVVTGLTNEAEYHFRISATNAGGTREGTDGHFTAGEWIVSLGDSFISGEGGRWAGNTESSRNTSLIEAGAYIGTPPNFPPGEAIPLCHRSTSAEIFIGGDVGAENLACSGAKTYSFDEKSKTPGVSVEFKPGLDFESRAKGEKLAHSGKGGVGKACPLVKCEGQALMLEKLAETENVRMVSVSIGGNDFNFGPIIQECVEDFLEQWRKRPHLCQTDLKVIQNLTPAMIDSNQRHIREAIEHVGEAVTNAADRDSHPYTIMVQTYPSPIPEAGHFRYGESDGRQENGGCGFWDQDATWANTVLLPTINNVVITAATEARSNGYPVAVLRLGRAFMGPLGQAIGGHRLCEEGTHQVGDMGGPASWTDLGAVRSTEWVNQGRIGAIWSSTYLIQEGLHPNYWGQLALRSCVREAFNAGSPVGGSCVQSDVTSDADEQPMLLSP